MERFIHKPDGSLVAVKDDPYYVGRRVELWGHKGTIVSGVNRASISSLQKWVEFDDKSFGIGDPTIVHQSNLTLLN